MHHIGRVWSRIRRRFGRMQFLVRFFPTLYPLQRSEPLSFTSHVYPATEGLSQICQDLKSHGSRYRGTWLVGWLIGYFQSARIFRPKLCFKTQVLLGLTWQSLAHSLDNFPRWKLTRAFDHQHWWRVTQKLLLSIKLRFLPLLFALSMYYSCSLRVRVFWRFKWVQEVSALLKLWWTRKKMTLTMSDILGISLGAPWEEISSKSRPDDSLTDWRTVCCRRLLKGALFLRPLHGFGQ